MRRIKFLACMATMLFAANCMAQISPAPIKQFHGAVASKKSYKVVYQLNSDNDKVIGATLKNIKNALEDPRLTGKLQVELVVHGGGIAVFKKESAYQQQLLDLKAKGVILAQCENTMRERNIGKEELYDFISFVPSGNGELIIRQSAGWAIIHP